MPTGGVLPHLRVGGRWLKYPKHRWFAKTAWHYTSVAGCFDIVSNHELWASSASMLNDVDEMRYGTRLVRDVFARWKSSAGSGAAAHGLLEDAVDALDDALVQHPPFVLSASTSPGLLNQWANYGESSGCAIGFRGTEVFHEAGQVVGNDPRGNLPLWLEVLYEPAEQAKYISTILDELVADDGLIAGAIESDQGAALLVEQNLSMLAATLKHPAFQAENEVRYVVAQQPSTVARFRPTARGVVPYVVLRGTTSDPERGIQFSSDPAAPLPLPIVGVRVGPPQGESELRRVTSMKRFLLARGYDVAVEGAGIPYLP